MHSKFPMLTLACCVVLLLNACHEIGPAIDFGDTSNLLDTTYVQSVIPQADHKVVLFEEFTGVHCVNCPIGHQLTLDLVANHPDSIVAVAIHNSNPQAEPFTGEPDFRTSEGIQISDNLGGTMAIPSASIDRFDFDADNQIAEYTPFWENRAKTRLKLIPPLNIHLTDTYDAASRELKVSATIVYTQSQNETNHLSLMIIESNIVSPQKLPDNSVDTFYVHNHVLRGMLTPVNGVLLNAPKVPGRVFIKDFVFTLPADWDQTHCDIVGFVHEIGNNKKVLQAAEIAIQ